VAGWRRGWRITVTWQSGSYSPTGEPVQLVDVSTAARLREVVLGARNNPRILTYSYRSHRVWDDSDAPRTCPRGHELMPGQSGGRDCQCGTGHFASECWCGAVQYMPALGPGCGPVPFDPDAGKHPW